MLAALVLQFILLPGFARGDEGPLATLACQTDGSNKVTCTVTAQVPDPKHPPQYTWTVSAGKREGNGPNIVVDATETKADSIVITVLVRWKDCPLTCDRSL